MKVTLMTSFEIPCDSNTTPETLLKVAQQALREAGFESPTVVDMVKWLMDNENMLGNLGWYRKSP